MLLRTVELGLDTTCHSLFGALDFNITPDIEFRNATLAREISTE